MKKRKRHDSRQSINRWLRLTIFLMTAALIGMGCSSSSDGTPPSPRTSTVEVERDDKGVWFITGEAQDTLYDVFEAMGYAVAADRLWQAEKFRRTGRGRLAEIFGPGQLSQDILVRTMGYSDEELEEGFASLDADSREVVDGYVAGFNRRIADIRNDPSLLPFEFSAVGITSETLEHWTGLDVLAWAVTMLRNFDPEAHRTGQIDNMVLFQGLAQVYGPAQGAMMFEDLRWLNDPDSLTYIPESAGAMTAGALSPPQAFDISWLPDMNGVAARMSGMREQSQESLEAINAYIGMGSYAWAISGSKTATGNPMIYSGPQMGFSVPAIVGEGSIRAAGLNVSGMHVPGLPLIIIGRTPHHAWSMQVGHARTVDYYLGGEPTLHRTEIIKVAGEDDVVLPVFRTAHGPVVNADPVVISWKYSHWGYEFNAVQAFMELARATSMDEFAAGIERVPVSQHFTYVDKDGNIAYWMSGRHPVRPDGEWRLPQGAVPGADPLEWDASDLMPRSTDRNHSQGYYCGWNNKSYVDYNNSWNNRGYAFGTFHRAHVIDDYLSTQHHLTFEQVRDLALYIASTDSFGGGGNLWHFVATYFSDAVNATPNDDRLAALGIMAAWDGHFVDGGAAAWAMGTDVADAYILIDTWIRHVLDLTFEELVVLPPAAQAWHELSLFNTLLNGLKTDGIGTYYDWFRNQDPAAPQTADEIIVAALDLTLGDLDLSARPWGEDRRLVIPFGHEMLGVVHEIPFSSRSTYAHVIEYDATGPVEIQSMFPLGASGTVLGYPTPVFDDHFFSMTGVYDDFSHRDFPLFTP